MARAALERSRADLAVAVTGFAGPRQGDEEVGLVHIAALRRGGDPIEQTCHFGDPGRAEVCRASVCVALEMLIQLAGSD
jgi:nicotinamide-nucleotide amidase